MAEQKCFEFVLSHKYDRLNGLKGHTTSHGPKWGKSGSAHKSEIPLEWLDDGKQRTT